MILVRTDGGNTEMRVHVVRNSPRPNLNKILTLPMPCTVYDVAQRLKEEYGVTVDYRHIRVLNSLWKYRTVGKYATVYKSWRSISFMEVVA